MSEIRTVFLDVGWTLAYPRASIWEIFARLCGEAGVATSSQDCERLVRSLWSSGQEQAEARVGANTPCPDSDEDFALMFMHMARVVFGHMGVTEDQEGLMQRFFAAFWTEENWVLFDEVPDALQSFRDRGLKLGVLSNAPSNLLDFLERLGISQTVDFTVVSGIEGMKKPDRRIFEVALERAQARPEETLHVGDMYIEDVLGGRNAGLHTLLVERGERSLFPSFRESDSRRLQPQGVINDLSQVLERIS
jgi:putative hydrolase of the HAD superfamily